MTVVIRVELDESWMLEWSLNMHLAETTIYGCVWPNFVSIFSCLLYRGCLHVEGHGMVMVTQMLSP